MTALAYVDGALVPRTEATVSIDDAAVRYGIACFESMRASNGRIFRLGGHLARLRAGLEAIGTPAPSDGELAAAVAQTLEANRISEGRVRLSVSPGILNGPDLGLARSPSVIVVADPLDLTAPAPQPLTLALASQRVDPTRPLGFAKHAHYLVYLIARAEARAAGASDALLLNTRGDVCEAATANIFAVIDGVLVTPPLADGPVPGVTRDAFLEIAASEGIPTAERTLTLDAFVRATEVFTSSSIAGAYPVTAIRADGRQCWSGAAPGPLTVRLAQGHARLLAAECPAG
ncbi:MAG: aminotransferase class IV [Chloroflexi bacterium]|nr:aminotransferase class IV [Chloroflexota bacterium]MDA1146575.1 aminotransferase class IV [Chloroflexota bacterium]MQC82735.1 hypothetical protein [Chloroflexota bacterium]